MHKKTQKLVKKTSINLHVKEICIDPVFIDKTKLRFAFFRHKKN